VSEIRRSCPLSKYEHRQAEIRTYWQKRLAAGDGKEYPSFARHSGKNGKSGRSMRQNVQGRVNRCRGAFNCQCFEDEFNCIRRKSGMAHDIFCRILVRWGEPQPVIASTNKEPAFGSNANPLGSEARPDKRCARDARAT